MRYLAQAALLVLASAFPVRAQLFWAEGANIRTASLSGGGATTVVTKSSITGVAIDAQAGKLYWTDNTTDTIGRANLDGNNDETLYTAAVGSANPREIALDLTNGMMYWAEGSDVKRDSLNGGSPTTFKTGSFPTSVAVDPQGGKVYWSDNGTDTISRADLDGNNEEPIYTAAVGSANPRGLALDTDNGTMYWAEGSEVWSAALDGTGPGMILTDSVPVDVTIDPCPGHVYWSDNGSDAIRRASLDGSGAEPVIAVTNPGAIALAGRDSGVFCDGFEAGTTGAWSLTQ